MESFHRKMEARDPKMESGENFLQKSIRASMDQLPVKYEPKRTSSDEVTVVQRLLGEIARFGY